MICSVCEKEGSIYRCPKCDARTCCLDCVKKHKINTNCDGIRLFSNILKTDVDLLSDVRFLENIDNSLIESVNTNREHAMMSTFVTKWTPQQRSLFSACRNRNIELKLCPVPMSIRKNNSSKASNNGKKLWWKISFRADEISFSTELDSFVHLFIIFNFF